MHIPIFKSYVRLTTDRLISKSKTVPAWNTVNEKTIGLRAYTTYRLKSIKSRVNTTYLVKRMNINKKRPVVSMLKMIFRQLSLVSDFFKVN